MECPHASWIRSLCILYHYFSLLQLSNLLLCIYVYWICNNSNSSIPTLIGNNFHSESMFTDALTK